MSIISFGTNRININGNTNTIELLRFCNKLNHNVVGGASKLIKHFIINENPSEIISYADRCWSVGRLYEKIGFELISITKPGYFYIKNNIRYNRFKFRKDILIKNGEDPNLSEKEIMRMNKYYIIYDSGNLKYSMKIKKD